MTPGREGPSPTSTPSPPHLARRHHLISPSLEEVQALVNSGILVDGPIHGGSVHIGTSGTLPQ